MAKVAIVGVKGAIGQVVAQTLGRTLPDILLRGGSRQIASTSGDNDNIEMMFVDVWQADSLSAFCQECQLVINCAGPSYLIGERVAMAAAQAGAHYIDPFGDEFLVTKLRLSEQYQRRCAVVSAGAYPGLSGLLARHMIDHELDAIHQLAFYSGGMESCTSAAALDWLLSTLEGFGQAGVGLHQGQTIRLSSPSVPVSIAGFPNLVQIQPFLNAELRRIAIQCPQATVCGYNLMTVSQVSDAIHHWCGELTYDRSAAKLQQAAEQLVMLATLATVGRPHWYHLMVEAAGEQDGQSVLKRVLLTSQSSYLLSGYLCVLCAEHLLNQPDSTGVQYADQLLDSRWVFDRLQHSDALRHFSITPLNKLTDIFASSVEFGEL